MAVLTSSVKMLYQEGNVNSIKRTRALKKPRPPKAWGYHGLSGWEDKTRLCSPTEFMHNFTIKLNSAENIVVISFDSATRVPCVINTLWSTTKYALLSQCRSHVDVLFAKWLVSLANSATFQWPQGWCEHDLPVHCQCKQDAIEGSVRCVHSGHT